MNFSDVKKWVIPEGDVKKVVDSNNRVIWEKDLAATCSRTVWFLVSVILILVPAG